jgi:hypothetical protein
MSDDSTLYPLILNSSNVVAGMNNYTYRYQFPAGSVKFSGSKVVVASVSLYYSWQSIKAVTNFKLYGQWVQEPQRFRLCFQMDFTLIVI